MLIPRYYPLHLRFLTVHKQQAGGQSTRVDDSGGEARILVESARTKSKRGRHAREGTREGAEGHVRSRSWRWGTLLRMVLAACGTLLGACGGAAVDVQSTTIVRRSTHSDVADSGTPREAAALAIELVQESDTLYFLSGGTLIAAFPGVLHWELGDPTGAGVSDVVVLWRPQGTSVGPRVWVVRLGESGVEPIWRGSGMSAHVERVTLASVPGTTCLVTVEQSQNALLAIAYRWTGFGFGSDSPATWVPPDGISTLVSCGTTVLNCTWPPDCPHRMICAPQRP